MMSRWNVELGFMLGYEFEKKMQAINWDLSTCYQPKPMIIL